MNFRSFLTLSLLTVLLLVSCAPAESPVPAQPEAPAVPATPVPVEEEPQAPAPSESEAEVPAVEPEMTEEPVVVIEPEFVPKGADLEATDPATVSLASGGLQLVEFFRFT